MTARRGILLLVLFLHACSRPATIAPTSVAEQAKAPDAQATSASVSDDTLLPTQPPTRSPDDLPPSPTPDGGPAPKAEQASASLQYIVQANDTLGTIAEEFNLDWQTLAAFNQLANPNQLEIGQVINIPTPDAEDLAPDLKLIPDSELVYGPAAVYLDIHAFAEAQGGYLAVHRDTAEGEMMDGTEMVAKIAREYSVNPKILLTLLELESGWVRDSNPRTSTLEFPLGYADSRRIGLYAQLAWAADKLNEGYYQWKEGLNTGWYTKDDVYITASPTVNAGTAAVQGLLAEVNNESQWREAISEEGFLTTYQLLFGYPFDFAIEPQIPADLQQPELQLPFEDGVPWIFSGGPHSGWGSYSAWAALDFVPYGEQLGCWQSGEWVVAAADGLILRADDGAVVQDLDGDGYEQSGWTLLYMHMAEYERVAAGTYVRAGERIGHASCEGGFASATHLHLARRYNGEWILADGDIPFVMDGWVPRSSGVAYDGTLHKGDLMIEACECHEPALTLQR